MKLLLIHGICHRPMEIKERVKDNSTFLDEKLGFLGIGIETNFVLLSVLFMHMHICIREKHTYIWVFACNLFG